MATREAWGTALAALGAIDPRVVALDADVKNSTFSDRFEKAFPDRFYQNFIAEQVMVGAAMGLAARGAIAFATTFACFLARAADFIRMAGLSNARHQLNVKLTGSHAGISIGEDGPSQMALEDLSMMRAVPDCAVLYPCDAVSAERLVAEMAAYHGLAYMRTSRPKTDIVYGLDERFPIGGSKVMYQSASDVATVVAAGVTVFEARKAYDAVEGRRHPHPGHRRLLGPADRCGDARRVGQSDQGSDHHRRGSLRDRRTRRRGRRSRRAGRLRRASPRRPGAAEKRPARRAPRSLRYFGQAHR